MRIFLLPTYLLGEEVGQSIHGGRGGGQQEDESRGNIFGKMGNTWSTIQGDHSFGHCFVQGDLIPIKFLLGDLIPITFFK